MCIQPGQCFLMPVLLIKVFSGGQLGIQQELLWNIIVIVCFGEFPPKIHSGTAHRGWKGSVILQDLVAAQGQTQDLSFMLTVCVQFPRLGCFVLSGSHRERLDLIWTQVHSQVWFCYNYVGSMVKMFGGNSPVFVCRYNHLAGDPKEVSPVIDQMLECTWQLTEQFPCAFEFNERFLITIHSHIYSCQYGNFIGNNERERTKLGWDLHPQSPSALLVRSTANIIVILTELKYNNAKINKKSTFFVRVSLLSWLQLYIFRVCEKTHSLWSHLCANQTDYLNPLYQPGHSQAQGLLRPSTAPHCFK